MSRQTTIVMRGEKGVKKGVSSNLISLCRWFLTAVLIGTAALAGAQETETEDAAVPQTELEAAPVVPQTELEDADVPQTEVEDAAVTPQTELEDAPVVPADGNRRNRGHRLADRPHARRAGGQPSSFSARNSSRPPAKRPSNACSASCRRT